MVKLRTRKKKVQGVGTNDAEYAVHEFSYKLDTKGNKVVDKRLWTCPYYATWEGMLRRVFSKRVQEKSITYKGYSVSDEWLTFSNFRKWMETQDWQGKDLDKDFLSGDSKIYSKETSIFIDKSLNQFMKDRSNDRGDFMLGVDKKGNGFQSRISNPFTKEREYLGYFQSEVSAHLAWKARKHELAMQWAALLEKDGGDARVIKVLKTKYK